MPTEFEHITIPSKNLDVSISFYTALGMQLIEHEPRHHAHFENLEHQVIFTAYYNEKRPDYEVKVYFETSDIEKIELRFRESANEISVIKDWGGKELKLTDPDGNHVILYQKLSADIVPPWHAQTNES
nr:VOC family protein [Dokdonia sinensis]